MADTPASIAAEELHALLASGEPRRPGGGIAAEADYLAEIEAELDRYFGVEPPDEDDSAAEIDMEEYLDTLPPEPGR